MTINTLKSALRFLKRNKLYAGITILGLALGLASAFVILIHVMNGFSFDRFHSNYRRIGRVTTEYKNFSSAMAPIPLANWAESNIAGVEKACAVARPWVEVQSNGIWEKGKRMVCTTGNFFNIFTFHVLSGRLQAAKDEVVLSKKAALYHFANIKDPVGQTLSFKINNTEKLLRVSGIIDDLPELSSLFACDYITDLSYGIPDSGWEINWKMAFSYVFVLAREDANFQDIAGALKLSGKSNGVDESFMTFGIQPMSEFYLNSANLANNALKTGSRSSLLLFAAIAILVLFMSCINYIILSAAMFSTKIKSVAVNRIHGASTKTISGYLVAESLALCLAAFILAIGLVELAVPELKPLFKNGLVYFRAYWAYFFVLTMVMAITTGLLVSFNYFRQNLISLLFRKTDQGGSKIPATKLLLVVQLFVFILLTIGSLGISEQMKFLERKDLGFNRNNLLYVELGEELASKTPVIKSKLEQMPGIVSVSASPDIIPSGNFSTFPLALPDEPNTKIQVEGFNIDPDFLDTYQIGLLDGRGFSEQFPADSAQSIILNETAVKQLNIDQPIGKIIEGWQVVGVVRDFNIHSLHSAVGPAALFVSPRQYLKYITLRYSERQESQIRAEIQKICQAMAPGTYFRMSSYDEESASLYGAELNLKKVVGLFTLLSIGIAMLGIFGYTYFMANRKTREIGIRKVNGATVFDIMSSLNKNLLKWVSIAFILAIPVSKYLLEKWMQDFAYRTVLGWWVFVLAGILALAVSLVTVSWLSWKAATRNPVEALRYE